MGIKKRPTKILMCMSVNYITTSNSNKFTVFYQEKEEIYAKQNYIKWEKRVVCNEEQRNHCSICSYKMKSYIT